MLADKLRDFTETGADGREKRRRGKEDGGGDERHDTNSTVLLSLTRELLKNNVRNRKACPSLCVFSP